jgi:hypothetical protein
MVLSFGATQNIDDAPREPIAEQVLDGLGHGAACFASAYEKDSLETIEIVGFTLDVEL